MGKQDKQEWAFCQRHGRRMPIDKHHVVYVSQGGAEGDVVEMCHLCHVQLHSDRNDFREWGRIGGKKTQATNPNWQMNLKQYREQRS